MKQSNRIWKALRIKFLRRYTELNSWMSKKETATETQIKTVSILKKLIVSTDSELTIAPISGTYYVRWRDIFVKFEGDKIHIINGKYSYEVWLTLKQSDDLLSFFKRRLEAKRKMIEKEIMEKTNRSLDDILKEIDTENRKINQ